MKRLFPLLLVACGPRPAPATAPPPAAVEATELEEAPPVDWTHTLYADHPLVGKIWRVSDGAFVNEAEVVAALKAADWRFLGEKHDNADHHRLQARMITALAPTGVAFEQLDDEDAIGKPATADALAEAVAWAESGWPDFALYRPVFEATLRAGASILPGHPTKDQVMTAARDGAVGLGEATAALPLDRKLSDAQRKDLADEVVESHCGHANESTIEMMIGIQRLKDAWMARAMSRHGRGAVLVAGNGHTRKDRGVPHYLDGTSVTLAFIEVAADERDPAAYGPPADFLWFTPRVDDEDPCEKYRGSLEKMGSSGE